MNERIVKMLRYARDGGPMAAALATGFICPAVLGAPGDLDPGFADVGRYRPPAVGSAVSIETQGESFVLAGGGLEWQSDLHGAAWWTIRTGYAIRVSSTGTTDFVAGLGMVLGTAPQGKENIVGIRHGEDVFRIGPNGDLDPSFGTDGVQGLWTWADDRPQEGSVAVDPGGMIVAAGSHHWGTELKVARLLPNGDPDDTFGTAGVVTVSAGFGQWISAPRIVSAGGGYRVKYHEVDHNISFTGCRVLALTSSGAVDQTFGDAGYADLGASMGELVSCNTIAPLPDGRVLVGGAKGAHPFLIRLLPDGSLDASFKIDALAMTGMAEVRALAIDAGSGDVLVGGQPPSGVTGAMAVRLHADGSLDKLFGSGGAAWIDMAGSSAVFINAVALQSSGDVLIAGGQNSTDPNYDDPPPFAARLVGDDGRDSPGVLGVRRFSYAATEGGEALVTVRRIGGKAGRVSVVYQTAPGSAVEGEDFHAVSGRLDWADGETRDKQIAVPVAPSVGSLEGPESFYVQLSENGGGAGLGTNTATVDIVPNGAAGGAFTIYENYPSFFETSGTLRLAVSRDYFTTGAVSVTVTPRSGTATAGDDFTADPVTLHWSDGEGGAKFIEISIKDDTRDEPDEQFSLELSDATGGALIWPHSSATYTIFDDDTSSQPPVDSGGGGGMGFVSLLLLGIARVVCLRRHGALLLRCLPSLVGQVPYRQSVVPDCKARSEGSLLALGVANAIRRPFAACSHSVH